MAVGIFMCNASIWSERYRGQNVLSKSSSYARLLTFPTLFRSVCSADDEDSVKTWKHTVKLFMTMSGFPRPISALRTVESSFSINRPYGHTGKAFIADGLEIVSCGISYSRSFLHPSFACKVSDGISVNILYK